MTGILYAPDKLPWNPGHAVIICPRQTGAEATAKFDCACAAYTWAESRRDLKMALANLWGRPIVVFGGEPKICPWGESVIKWLLEKTRGMEISYWCGMDGDYITCREGMTNFEVDEKIVDEMRPPMLRSVPKTG